MADTIIDNINSIIRTKSELKSVLTENGQNPSDTFSEYPEMFRSAISTAAASGVDEETINSYISAYLSAYDFIDQDALSANSYLTQHQDLSSYASKSYVADYVATYAPVPDLSSYVTKTELSSCGYLTQHQDISGKADKSELNSYVSKTELSAQSYLTSVPNTYPTYAAIENMAYITMDDVSACGYITASDIPSVVVPVIDENLIPNTTDTYTLGDSSHLYAYTYTNRVNIGSNKVYIYNNGDTQMKFGVNNVDRFRIDYNTFAPSITGAVTQLGTSNNPFTNTYTSYLFLNGTDIKTMINNMFSYDTSTGTLTITYLT